MTKKKIIIILSVVLLFIVIGFFVFKGLNNTQEELPAYTVTFVDYDGNKIKEEKVEEGSKATAPNNPNREGYDFIGWDKEFNNITKDIIITALYEKNNKPKFIVDNVEAKAGDEQVKVAIKLEKNPDISSIALTITFDNSLTLTSVVYNEEIGGYSLPPENLSSPIKLIWISPLENVSGDFTFVTLEFNIATNANGKLPITISYNPDDIYDMTEVNIDVDIINGEIVIVD